MAGSDARIFVGLDFGTESVRVIAADARGRTIASAVEPYRHGQIVPGSTAAEMLFEHPLPASFALPGKSELFMRIVASALGSPVVIHQASHGSALGAAILAALAAGSEGGGFDDPGQAVESMAGGGSPGAPGGPGRVVEPDARWTSAYEACYERYRRFAAALAQGRFD